MDKTREFIRAHSDDDVRILALKGDKYPDIDMKYALQQIEGRQKAVRKLPEFARIDGLVYPPGISLEQCSSSHTAALKCEIVKSLPMNHSSMADLTGGFGVDFSFIAPLFADATYVERSAELCAAASVNMPLLGLHKAHIIHDEAEKFIEGMNAVDFLFLDPARRDKNGRRTYAMNDCTPDVVQLQQKILQKSSYAMIKLSPMLDWHEAVRLLPTTKAVYIVSVDNECKEMLVVMSNHEGTDSLSLHCCHDGKDFLISNPTDEKSVSGSVSRDIDEAEYIYEPNASIMKSGCFGCLTSTFDVKQIATNSHLFISDKLINDFPGRRFRIEEIIPLGDKRMKNILKANVAVRNFPMDVALIRKRFKIADGGDIYIFATTDSKQRRLFFVCRKA